MLLDPAKVSIYHEQAIAKDIQVVYDINKYTFKSRKHESEIAHIRHAMVKDGVALCHFFHWLEKHFIKVNAFQNSPLMRKLRLSVLNKRVL